MAPDFHNPELSVSRINRLMRPLRNRCDALMAFTGSTRPTNCATYSSRSRRSSDSIDIDSPPLAVLQPPGSIHTRTHFSKNGAERLEMSKRVYAVRDSFRDIIVKTNPGQSQVRCSGNGVIALSAMCSMVIGANLRREVDEFEEDDDIDGTNFVNELYEAVPLEYRRWMIVSHALHLIQETNIRDATLFTILFDVTTSHGLFNESSTLLRSLLSIAFSPTTTSTSSPLTHPAHTTFLLDLRTRWIDGGLPDPAFFSIVTQVLSLTQDINLWTCKAVKKFAQSFCHANLTLFMQFLTVFATGADSLVRSKRCQTNTHATQLYKWVKLVFGQLLSASSSGAVIHTTAENSDATLDFLKTCLTSGLIFKATHRNDDDTSLIDLQGAIVSFATHWLTWPFSSTYPSDFALVVNRLGVVTPQTSTYEALVQGLFTGLAFHNGRDALFRIAGALKSHNLLRLEASMWPCALRYIEIPENERHFIALHSTDLFNQYRHELIGVVEDAERRCFGQSELSLDLTPIRTRKCTGNVPSGRAAANHGWRWEPMVDCWVHGPAHQSSAKKKSSEGNHWLRSTRLRHFSSHGKVKSTPRRITSTDRSRQTASGIRTGGVEKHRQPASFRSSRQRNCSPRRHSWNAPKSPEWDDEFDDPLLEKYPPSGQGLSRDYMKTPLARPSTNFASLVADAVTGRTELHVLSHPRPADVMRDLYNTPDLLESPWQDSSPPRAGTSSSLAIYLPSDDSLDLFAYGQTSPVTCR